MNQSPLFTSLLSLLILAVTGLMVWAAFKAIRFFANSSRKKNLELSKLAHEVEGIKDELKAHK